MNCPRTLLMDHYVEGGHWRCGHLSIDDRFPAANRYFRLFVDIERAVPAFRMTDHCIAARQRRFSLACRTHPSDQRSRKARFAKIVVLHGRDRAEPIEVRRDHRIAGVDQRADLEGIVALEAVAREAAVEVGGQTWRAGLLTRRGRAMRPGDDRTAADTSEVDGLAAATAAVLPGSQPSPSVIANVTVRMRRLVTRLDRSRSGADPCLSIYLSFRSAKSTLSHHRFADRNRCAR